MERLTDYHFDGSGAYMVCSGACIDDDFDCNNCEKLDEMVDRLAAYEDFMERWRLRDLEEAGRIFQRVNALGGTDLMAQYRDLGSIDHLQELVQAEKDGRLVVLDEPMKPLVWGDDEHDFVLCPNCNHDLMGGFQDDEYYENPMYQCPYCGRPVDGTKVLTREEAEAALKKREADTFG